MHMLMSLYLSIYLSIYLPINLSIYISIYLGVLPPSCISTNATNMRNLHYHHTKH